MDPLAPLHPSDEVTLRREPPSVLAPKPRPEERLQHLPPFLSMPQLQCQLAEPSSALAGGPNSPPILATCLSTKPRVQSLPLQALLWENNFISQFLPLKWGLMLLTL